MSGTSYEFSQPFFRAPLYDVAHKQQHNVDYDPVNFRLSINGKCVAVIGREVTKQVVAQTLRTPGEEVDVEVLELKQAQVSTISQSVRQLNSMVNTALSESISPWMVRTVSDGGSDSSFTGITFRTVVNTDLKPKTTRQVAEQMKSVELKKREQWQADALKGSGEGGTMEMKKLIGGLTDVEVSVLHKLVTDSGPVGLTIPQITDMLRTEFGTSNIPEERVIRALERIAKNTKEAYYPNNEPDPLRKLKVEVIPPDGEQIDRSNFTPRQRIDYAHFTFPRRQSSVQA